MDFILFMHPFFGASNWRLEIKKKKIKIGNYTTNIDSFLKMSLNYLKHAQLH